MNNHNTIWQEMMMLGQMTKNKIHTVLSQIASAHDVTVHQLMLLLGIYNAQVNTIGDVTRELDLLQANASTLCKKMESLGYVQRYRNEQDVRVVNVRLTNKGHDIVQMVISDMAKRFHRVQKENIDLQAIQRGFQELDRFMQMMEGNRYE